jgi:ribosome-associated protein
MLQITDDLAIPMDEINFEAIRAQGAGGQNVNKTATAVQLRFDVCASSLPEFYKERLLQRSDKRINSEGVVVIKAQQHRSLEQNKEEALRRLQQLIQSVAAIAKPRTPTKPTKSAREKRLVAKRQRSAIKTLRKKISED